MAANEVIVELSEPQTRVMDCRAQRILNMAGQGGGKTGTIGYITGMMIELFPALEGFIGANTYEQLSSSTLKGVFAEWQRVYGWTEYHADSNPEGDFVMGKIPPPHFQRNHIFKSYKNLICFRSGAVVYTGSLDKYRAHDGKEFAWSHLDETKDTKEEALTEVVFGRLRQRGLWYDRDGNISYGLHSHEKAAEMGLTAWNPCYIHTSPAVGIVKWLNKMFDLDPYEKEIRKEVMSNVSGQWGYWYREFGIKAVCIYSAFHNARNLPPNFLETQLASMSAPKAEKLVYGLPFSKSGTEYYPYFERLKHVTKVRYHVGEPVHQTWDFNVVPYMSMLCAEVLEVQKWIDKAMNKKDVQENESDVEITVTQVRFYKEYCLKSPLNSTESVCERWEEDQGGKTDAVFLYGDGSGMSRIPGMGSKSNVKEIKETLRAYLHNASNRFRFPNVAPLKRRDLLNDILSGKYPDIEIYFDEEMINTIKDFEDVKLGKKGKVKKRVYDKEVGESYEENGHTSDGVEYMICELFREKLMAA